MKLKISNNKKISSAFDFAKDIYDLGQKENIPSGATSAIWFRGQAEMDWELKHSIGRTVKNGGLYDSEKSNEEFYETERVILQRFKRDGYPFVQRMLSDWEAITLGQHHYLPTRLLDWTSNPLTALYFAAEGSPDVDAAVFAYRPQEVCNHHISMFEGQNPKKNPNHPIL